MRYLYAILALVLAASSPQAGEPEPPRIGGAACVMAKWRGNTLDYVLIYGKKHPVLAQEEGAEILRGKGYARFKGNLDIIHHQAKSYHPHAYAIVIKTTYTTKRGKPRTSYGCGFSPLSYDAALQEAGNDLQSYSWGWDPQKHGYGIVEQVRY